MKQGMGRVARGIVGSLAYVSVLGAAADGLWVVRPVAAQMESRVVANPLAAAVCQEGGGVPKTFERILYVDQDDSSCSNSGGGSPSRPFCSIQAAVDAAKPGTAIRIRDAATPYNESVVVRTSGEPGKPVAIEADMGHKPVLTNTVNTGGAGGTHSAGVISIIDASYVVVRNLTFNGFDQITSASALFVHAKTRDTTDVILTGNSIINWAGTAKGRERKGTAVWLSRAYPRRVRNAVVRCNTLDNNRFEGIKITGNDVLVEQNIITRMRCGLDESEKGEKLHTNAQAIKVNNTSAFEGDKRITTALNLIIRHNYIDGIVKECPYAEIVGPKGMSGGGIWCDVGAAGGEVYGNTIFHMIGAGHGGGWWGIHIESRCDNWRVHDNLVANNETAEYAANYRLRNNSGTVFENNVSCGGDRAFWLLANSQKAVTVRNNQMYGGRQGLLANDAVINDTVFARGHAKSSADHAFMASNKHMGTASCPGYPMAGIGHQQ